MWASPPNSRIADNTGDKNEKSLWPDGRIPAAIRLVRCDARLSQYESGACRAAGREDNPGRSTHHRFRIPREGTVDDPRRGWKDRLDHA